MLGWFLIAGLPWIPLGMPQLAMSLTEWIRALVNEGHLFLSFIQIGEDSTTFEIQHTTNLGLERAPNHGIYRYLGKNDIEVLHTFLRGLHLFFWPSVMQKALQQGTRQ